MSLSNPAPHNINSDSTSNHKVQHAAGIRVQTGGLNLPVSQVVSIPGGLKHEIVTINSSTAPAWGSYVTIDIREKNILMNDIILQVVTAPVSGTTLVGYFVPALYFFSKIEIVQAGNTIQTVYDNYEFLMNQFLDFDEDRLSTNNASSNYSNTVQRGLLSSQTSNNTFYINLKSYINEAKIAMLTDQHNIQLRLTMNSLANSFTVVSGTLTSAPVLSLAAICKVTKLDAQSASIRLQEMINHPQHSIFHDSAYMPVTIQSGILSANIPLQVPGNISCIFFTLRGSTIGKEQWNYKQIQSFALQEAGGTNIVGGSVLPASLCANLLNAQYIRSSYNTETSFGINDQNANFYMWSFSADNVASLSTGQALSSKKFIGGEILQINFATATIVPYQLDIYFMVESILEVTHNSVKKMSI